MLAVTGVEALYADMGHFGARPIRIAWTGLVLPALALNYLGQGALLMRDPTALENPFFRLFPSELIWPALGLATLAAIIASQAVISGAYSMTRQAIQLGFLPRMTILHTSAQEEGQIYLPVINWLLLAVIVAIVLGFGSSSRLAGAYGIAVTGTMLITTVLTFFVIRYRWKLNLALCIVATLGFFVVDAAFFGANLLKIVEGGWFPLIVGVTAFVVMVTWQGGRAIVRAQQQKMGIELDPFLKSLEIDPPHRVPGIAVFLVADGSQVPRALLHNLLHNKVLHERVVFLTAVTEDVPSVPPAERARVETLAPDVLRVRLSFGFNEPVDVPQALTDLEPFGEPFEPMLVSYFIGRETIIPTVGDGMSMWRERLFATMMRNAGSAADYFRLPTNRVIELGAQLGI